MLEKKLKILKTHTILLVDDDEQILKNLKLTLSIFFDNVITANNGVEALNIYKSDTSIDIIMTDYVMPKMSGYDLCKKIRALDKNILIIMMSNYTEKEKLLKSIPLGLIDYLEKPIKYEILFDALLEISDNLKAQVLKPLFSIKNIEYCFIKKEIKSNNQILKLTKNEVIILELLIKSNEHVVTIDQLNNALNKENVKSEQSIKNLLYRLRQKIGKDKIINNKGLGYALIIN